MKPFRNGQEAQSGTIRRDPAWVRGRRDDSRAGEKARGASPDGAAGDRQRDPTGTKEGRSEATATRTAERAHRPDAGTRPRCAAEAESHGLALDSSQLTGRGPWTFWETPGRSAVMWSRSSMR